MCDHNWDSIEICSAQQAETGEELLYTETDFLKCMCWQMLTGSRSHAGSHIDNVTLLIMLLYQLAGDSVFILGSRPNLELPVEHPVTAIQWQAAMKDQVDSFMKNNT